MIFLKKKTSFDFVLKENNSQVGISQMIDATIIRNKITAKGLRVTPQRMRVLEAIYQLSNHPTAESILSFIRETDPNVASGTVYKVLDTFVKQNIISRVKTDKDAMRYDGIIEKHHHLYCLECDHIEDFVSKKLDETLKSFFEKNKIDNFIIEDIKLNISGTFVEHKK